MSCGGGNKKKYVYSIGMKSGMKWELTNSEADDEQNNQINKITTKQKINTKIENQQQ